MKKILAIILTCCAFVLAVGLVACGGSSSGSAAASGSASGSPANASGASSGSDAKAQAQADGYLDQYGIITAKALSELDGAALTKVAESAGYTWNEKHASFSKIGSQVSPSKGLNKEQGEAAGYSITDTSKYDFTPEEVAGFAVGGKGTPVVWLVSSKAAYADVADVLANQQVKVVDQCEVEHRNYGKQIWSVIENSAGDRFLLCTSYYSNLGEYKLFTADYIATNQRGIASSFNHNDYLLEDAHTIDAVMEVLKSGQVS